MLILDLRNIILYSRDSKAYAITIMNKTADCYCDYYALSNCPTVCNDFVGFFLFALANIFSVQLGQSNFRQKIYSITSRRT